MLMTKWFFGKHQCNRHVGERIFQCVCCQIDGEENENQVFQLVIYGSYAKDHFYHDQLLRHHQHHLGC